MTSENAVSDFIGVLGKLAPGVEATVDAPCDPNGETFIDVKAGNFSTEVSYRPAFGFGIYIKNATFGQRPDEVFRHAGKAATRVSQLRDAFEKYGTIKQLTIADMSVLVGLGDAPEVQKKEIFLSDQQVSALGKIASHIHAMGGRLEMSVVFDDMEARLELPLSKEAE